MKRKQKLKRRAVSILLYHAQANLEVVWRMLGMLVEQDEALVIVREGPLMHGLTDKELKLLKQRKTKLYEISKDLGKIARHLHKTSV